MAQQTAVMQLINFILVERRQEDGSIKFHAHEDFSRFLQIEKEQMGYTKEDVLKAGEIGEINHYDYKHIVSLLDEAREINRQNK